MSDYELVDAFMSHANIALTYFMGFISATSAFVVIGHIAARDIPASLANIATAIYTVASVFFVASFQRVSTAIVAIRDQMGESLIWHPAAAEPAWVLHGLVWSGFGATAILYTSAIWYFFHARKVPPNQAIEPDA